MEYLQFLIQAPVYYLLPFVVALSIIVFVHELGHFLVGRWCGVNVETFSIGFGKEITGWNDRQGTRWRLAWIPLGGYVKFEGDTNPASTGAAAPTSSPTAFNNKTLLQKAAIVAAGPIANFLLATAIFTFLYSAIGELQVPPRADTVMAGSAAEKAGLKPGDYIRKVDGKPIEKFNDLQRIIFDGDGKPVTLTIERGGSFLDLNLTPVLSDQPDNLGGTVRTFIIGITHEVGNDKPVYKRYGIAEALVKGVDQTKFIITSTLKFIGKLVTGRESTKQLGGPAMIATGAGQAAQMGFAPFISFLAFISVSIGLINLFPVPILDGGHLAMYALEAVRGKPVAPQTMEWAARIGLSLVVLLLFVSTFNDILRGINVWGNAN